MNETREMIRARRRKAHNDRRDSGKYRFCTLAASMNLMDKRHGAEQKNKMSTKELRTEFFKRHPDMLFKDEDGTMYLMTLTSGASQISVDRIHDRLPDGDYAPHTLENIRFVPLKLNVALKASLSDIERHKETMKLFTCPVTLTRSEYCLIRHKIYNARSTCKLNGRPERGIGLDPLLTTERLVYKLLHDQKMICAISGLPMLLVAGSPFSISLDRICNNLGYTYENTQFVCRFKQFADGCVSQRKDETMEQTNERRKRLRFV
jgi:hypothetical protein